MKKIAALYYSGGYYEDENEFSKILLTSFDENLLKKEAEKHAEKRKALHILKNELEAFSEQYNKNNPFPVYPTLEKIKKWDSGLRENEITDEMRAERNEVKARNEVKKMEYEILHSEWRNKYLEAEKQFFETKGIKDEDIISEIKDYRHCDNPEYEIGYLEFI